MIIFVVYGKEHIMGVLAEYKLTEMLNIKHLKVLAHFSK
jgi:hypothetical protein